MKKALWIIVCIVIFIGVFASSVGSKIKDIFGGELIANFTLAGESAPQPLTEKDMSKEIVDVRYIKCDGAADTRQMIIYWPADKQDDIPVVYVPHYAAEENTSDFVSYIKHGWAVASTYNFKSDYNGVLSTDDLVFNNAALYTLRHTDGIDKQRIALVGGSAGGYMTLMLSGLQMGTTAAIANSPITNVYFNAHKYFPACDELNRSSGLFDFIMPIQGLVSKSFQPVNSVIGDDFKRWEEVSPISMARCYSSPVVLNHNTSDILVPIDQITHKYAYAENDGTLPKGFNCTMSNDYPGILSKTFEEMADPAQLTINHIKLENYKVEGDMRYGDTLITLNVFDDGAPTAKGSHAHPKVTGSYNIFPYLEEMMEKTLAETEQLIPEKLILMLKRYQGKSLALPAHEGVDDTIYGSLAVYKQEIVEELNMWMNNHSEEEMDTAVKAAIAALDASEQIPYMAAWEEILSQR